MNLKRQCNLPASKKPFIKKITTESVCCLYGVISEPNNNNYKKSPIRSKAAQREMVAAAPSSE